MPAFITKMLEHPIASVMIISTLGAATAEIVEAAGWRNK